MTDNEEINIKLTKDEALVPKLCRILLFSGYKESFCSFAVADIYM
jgi:hypothetical protein